MTAPVSTMRRRDWWTRSAGRAEAGFNLLKAIGRVKGNAKRTCKNSIVELIWIVSWVDNLLLVRASACAKSRDGRVITREACRILADDQDKRTAFDSIMRLGSKAKASEWIVKLVRGEHPKTTPEENEARRRSKIGEKARARSIKKEEHARTMLERHERALLREQRLVERWRSVVARYDRRFRAPA